MTLELEAEVTVLHATVTRLSAQIRELLAAASGKPPGGDRGAGSCRTKGLTPTQAPACPYRRGPDGLTAVSVGMHLPGYREVHALARCPDCGAPLAGGTTKRTREVIEVPVAPVVTARVCKSIWSGAACRRRR